MTSDLWSINRDQMTFDIWPLTSDNNYKLGVRLHERTEGCLKLVFPRMWCHLDECMYSFQLRSYASVLRCSWKDNAVKKLAYAFLKIKAYKSVLFYLNMYFFVRELLISYKHIFLDVYRSRVAKTSDWKKRILLKFYYYINRHASF